MIPGCPHCTIAALILRAMLQRLDVTELRHLHGTDPATLLATLPSGPGKAVELPASVPAFRRPDYPESEWSNARRRRNA